jgi:hypothetical protein
MVENVLTWPAGAQIGDWRRPKQHPDLLGSVECALCIERVTGIEPASRAWELHDIRRTGHEQRF